MIAVKDTGRSIFIQWTEPVDDGRFDPGQRHRSESAGFAVPFSHTHTEFRCPSRIPAALSRGCNDRQCTSAPSRDRKSTRLNSSHSQISYAVFCLKKKKKKKKMT